MAIMLICPHCKSDRISRDLNQNKIKKSDCFFCNDCYKTNRLEHMEYEPCFGSDNNYSVDFDENWNGKYTIGTVLYCGNGDIKTLYLVVGSNIKELKRYRNGDIKIKDFKYAVIDLTKKYNNDNYNVGYDNLRYDYIEVINKPRNNLTLEECYKLIPRFNKKYWDLLKDNTKIFYDGEEGFIIGNDSADTDEYENVNYCIKTKSKERWVLANDINVIDAEGCSNE